jgi:pyruvate/2-oxoglutarate/acetoin dehydrogenase E1 component
VKITGGPDGDVAGNMMRILDRDYGANAVIVGIGDGSGVGEDPEGLDHAELLRLFKEGLPIASFDRKRLSPKGRVVSVDEPEGAQLRNTMHNRLVTDAFVPGGGRPATIDDKNWSEFLTSDGAPSSKVISEGANLFLTPEARRQLSARGAVIIKDSTANKCGVICSSYEIGASMLLDEQSILGMALGSGLNGRLPIPEIQYLAYLHNAEDQLRGEAATLGFFSNGQYRNPMVVRIPGYGYQKGFGGHFHNDDSIAVLRDIPGLVIASPAHPADAAPMLRSCVAHARATGAVCVYLEPIARYHDPDLHELGDSGWASAEVTATAELGRAHRYRPSGDAPCDLTILTWANGTYLSLRAQQRLETELGIRCLVVDLRWIAPMPIDDMIDAAEATGRVLIVDETRRSGGVGEGIIAALVERGVGATISRVAAADSFVPLGAAANLVLVSEDDIVTAASKAAR